MITPKKKAAYVVWAAILACPLALPAKSKEKPEEVNFTSSTELVLVPTVVTGKSGGHITGLTKEDFHIFENGVEQKIVSFDEMTSNTQLRERSASPAEYSNFSSGESQHGRITLIVLDFINTAFGDQVYARGQLMKYLAESSNEREPTALYTLNRSGIHIIHDFTDDPRILSAALHKVNGDSFHLVDTPQEQEQSTGTASARATSTLDVLAVQNEAGRLKAMMDKTEQDMQSFEQQLAITETLQGLRALAEAFRGTPVRKSLIWVSGGFPFGLNMDTLLPNPGHYSLTDVTDDYERTWQMLTDAQIALYPIDARGLAGFPVADASIGNPGPKFSENAIVNQMDTIMTFRTFASMTGGRAYVNYNDLDTGFREAVSDSSQYYMLGYYLDRSSKKEGWRRLAVKVKQEHVQVRARSGLFVTKSAPNPESSRLADVDMALASPLDYTSLAITVKWGNVKPSKVAGKQHVLYQVHLEPDTGLLNGGDNNHLRLEFIVRAKTPEGKWAGDAVASKVDAHPPEATMAELRHKGVSAVGGLDLAPGEYTLRLVVRDDISGRMGSVSAPLKVD